MTYLLVFLAAKLMHHQIWRTPLLSMFLLTFFGTLFQNGLHLVGLWVQGVEFPVNQAFTRYKGLGEFQAQELFDTTMNPETRKLCKIVIPDDISIDRFVENKVGSQFFVAQPGRLGVAKYNKMTQNHTLVASMANPLKIGTFSFFSSFL